jgi:hypothetical protein
MLQVRAIAVGVGIVGVAAIGAVTFTRAPHVPSATAAPVNTEIQPPLCTTPGAPATASAPSGTSHFVETLDVGTFQRGNIHTHSAWSDGDSPPKDVYTWYRSHGYAFLALTDHENRVSPETFAALERPGFVIIPGEEITMWAEGKPVHVNGLCTTATIPGGHFPSKQAALSHAISNVLGQGGVALVNHPNFDWALTANDVRGARGAQLLEIWSGHPYVHTEGDGERPSHEVIWQALLDSGSRFAGVAVDDTHFIRPPPPSRAKGASRPGRGWIEVFAPKPDRAAICDALGKGRLYSSSGASLERIRVTDDAFSVWPKEEGAAVEFVGEGGKILAKGERGTDRGFTYRLRGDERYVRARVALPNGKQAWTQAYFVAR